jgi:arginine exporter protein ArgO
MDIGGPFLAGAAAGYGIAIPVGAIAILIVETALRSGLSLGLAAGAGAASVDGLYALVAVLAGRTATVLLGPWMVDLRIAAAFVLAAVAFRGIWRLHRGSSEQPTSGDPGGKRWPSGSGEPRALSGAALATYLRFVGLTLLNPLTIVYFTALALGLTEVVRSPAAGAAFAGGAFGASLSWQILLATIGALLRRLPGSAVLTLDLVGHLVVLALAIRILTTAVAAS